MRAGLLTTTALLLAGAAPAHAAEQVLYVGDSLGVGTTPQLRALLGGQADVHGDSRIGRPSEEGLAILQDLITPSDGIVVFDLGTNDDPSQPGRLAANLQSARQESGTSCMVVATLNRPPLNGVPVDGMNQTVEAFAAQAAGVQLVDWHEAVREQPGLLGPDGVHPTPQGYQQRARLFAEAIASCGALPSATRPTRKRPRIVKPSPRPTRRPRKPIKVPGIDASGISFTAPVVFKSGARKLTGELLLPTGRPPYASVVMVQGRAPATREGLRAQAELYAGAGIAALIYDEPRAASSDAARAADARAAVSALEARSDIRRGRVALRGSGRGAHVAALAAGGNRSVAAVVAVSPGLAPATNESWAVRRALGDSGTAPIATWYRVTSGGDDAGDPSGAWQRVAQPVLAVWAARDPAIPVRASATALANALESGQNRDRTFRFTRGGRPPGDAAAVRWLKPRLAGTARPAVVTTGPTTPDDPKVIDATNASGLTSRPAQIIWLALPVLLLTAAALSARARMGAGAALIAAAGLALASLACIAIGAATAVHAHGRGVSHVFGVPVLFAVARVLAVAAAAVVVLLARRRAWLPAAATALWVALALFWLL